jgi:hypothetical protein
MTVEKLKEENRRLRRRLRDTRDTLRDAEDTIEWVGKMLERRAASTQEG